MFYTPTKYLGTLALVLALGACETGTVPVVPMAMHSPYDEQDLRLVIKGQNAIDALDSSTKIHALLGELGTPPGPNLRGRINMFLNSPGGNLAGLGGVQSRASLKVARVTTNSSGNFAGMLTDFEVTGQIQQSVWGETGFYYKPNEPMHMWVQMITTATRDPGGGGTPKVKRWAEMFRIEVPADDVHVDPKVADTGNGVFPDFADEAFPISSTMATGLNFKLWVVGTDVTVTNYWIDKNYNGVGDPSYKKYTMAKHPANLHSIFEPDAEACIDMMFELDPDGTFGSGGALLNGELPPNTKPPYYCLGRCRNPPIVNTK